MPIIQLQDDGLDGLRVLSTMYFPTAESERARLLRDFELLIGPGTIPESGAVEEAQRWVMTVSDTGWRGTVAGEGLLRLAMLRDGSIPEPSMRKVVTSLRQHAIDLRTDPNTQELSNAHEDRTIAITEKSMWNYLAEFKSVCHLWAAHRILEQNCPFYYAPTVLSDEHELAQFLAHAEWFLVFGASQMSRNRHAGSLLDRAAAWVPSRLSASSKPDFDAWPPSLLEAVKNYRATR